jgi:MFS transporter, FHS family, L-fucose permease
MNNKQRLIPNGVLLPFVLITSLFFLWGLANNMTDTLLAAFKRIMSMSDAQTGFIQIAAYGFGYFIFALPAALYIKRFSYKSGILLGLGFYLFGCFLFYPAMITGNYFHFLGALWILFGGLSILETASNPYIIAMGAPETATRRLNLAQSFNPIGSIFGVFISQIFILSSLNRAGAEERSLMNPSALKIIQQAELNSITNTYIAIGVILLFLWIVILFTKMPKTAENEAGSVDFLHSLKRLMKNRNYSSGVVAQFFYVGAQIGIWSFTIRYAMQELNLESIALTEGRTAEEISANYYLASLFLFVGARFVFTGLMKYFNPSNLLFFNSVLAIGLSALVVFVGGRLGVYALVGISGCMSLMFPTIFGIAIKGLGDDAKIGGAGLIMTIVGGAVITQIQGTASTAIENLKNNYSDQVAIIEQMPSGINMAFLVPAICFIIIALYSMKVMRKAV